MRLDGTRDEARWFATAGEAERAWMRFCLTGDVATWDGQIAAMDGGYVVRVGYKYLAESLPDGPDEVHGA